MAESNDEFDELLARYQSGVENNQHTYFDAEEIGMIVDYYLWIGSIKDAQKALAFGQKLHPNSSEMQIRQAKLFAVTGEKEKALQLLAANNPMNDNLEILLVQGEILASLHRFDEAERVFAQVLKNEDFNYDDICFDVAYTYIAQESFERGLKYLTLGNKYNPKNLDILYEIAYCNEQIGNWNKAIETYNRILDLDTYSEEAWFYLGQVHYAREEYQDAYKAFDFVTVINERNAEAWLQKSHALFQLEKYKEALEGYMMYYDLAEDKAEALVCMAECYEELETFDKARSHYEKALQVNPLNLEAYIGLAYSFLQSDYFDKAIEYADKAIALDPTQYEPWTYRGEACMHLEKYTEAVEAYNEALKLDPSQVDVWTGLGHIYMLTIDFEMAYSMYAEALRLNPETENIQLFLAIVQYKLGKMDESLASLKEAMIRNSKAISLFFEVCPEAVEVFEKRIKLD